MPWNKLASQARAGQITGWSIFWLCWSAVSLSAQPLPGISHPNCPGGQTQFNTSRQGDVIVLGRPANYHYVVVVPLRHPLTLQQVRACVLDAFQAESKLGPYVHAGSFRDRAQAETLSHWLRQMQGVDARVVYFP